MSNPDTEVLMTLLLSLLVSAEADPVGPGGDPFARRAPTSLYSCQCSATYPTRNQKNVCVSAESNGDARNKVLANDASVDTCSCVDIPGVVQARCGGAR